MAWRKRSLRQKRRRLPAHAPELAPGHAPGQSGLFCFFSGMSFTSGRDTALISGLYPV